MQRKVQLEIQWKNRGLGRRRAEQSQREGERWKEGLHPAPSLAAAPAPAQTGTLPPLSLDETPTASANERGEDGAAAALGAGPVRRSFSCPPGWLSK